jgi:hypothetical protein
LGNKEFFVKKRYHSSTDRCAKKVKFSHNGPRWPKGFLFSGTTIVEFDGFDEDG